MKITNYQALILLELENTKSDDGIWRPELAERLNTPTSTLHDNLIRLQIKELVEKYDENDGKRGRNRIYWHITELGEKAVYVIRRGMI